MKFRSILEERRYKEGKCILCEEQRINARHCDAHRLLYNKKAKAKRLKRARQGKCSYCNNSPIKNREYCLQHQIRRDELRRERTGAIPRKFNK